MNAYSKSEQVVQSSNEQVVTEAKVPYEAPQVTVMGRVEDLTAVGPRGSRDIIIGHNLL